MFSTHLQFVLAVLVAQFVFISWPSNANGQLIADIPFHLNDQKNMIVTVTLNGTDKINAMFHFAENDFTLTEEGAKKAKSVVFTEEVEVESWGGKSTSRMSPKNQVELGGLKQTNVNVFEDKFSGPESEGKIGLDFFQGKFVEFDNERRRLLVYETLPEKCKAWESVPLKHERGSFFLQALVRSQNQEFEHRFLLHSGYGGGVLLDDAFVSKTKIGEQIEIVSEQKLKDSFGNIIVVKKGVLPEIKLGPVTLEKVPVGFFQGKLGQQEISLLGCEVWQRLNFVFDTNAPKLYLKPRENVGLGVEYGNSLSALDRELAGELAKSISVNERGAIGRNRSAYFHARFQAGMHRLVDFGLATKNRAAIEKFVAAAEFAFEYQLEDGSFAIELPAELKGKGAPKSFDLASGTAFFAASLGAGWLAIETNDWTRTSDEMASVRERLGKLKPKATRMIEYLKKENESLLEGDRAAPNRLLFDALAFQSMGAIVQDSAARDLAQVFVAKAKSLVHSDGYFIEGGGYDSSYNGVATALALRLYLIGRDESLKEISERAVVWQVGRIDQKGAISTEGNSRVKESGGETFLGRIKDVDVGYTVELLMLGELALEESALREHAMKVIEHYRR